MVEALIFLTAMHVAAAEAVTQLLPARAQLRGTLTLST